MLNASQMNEIVYFSKEHLHIVFEGTFAYIVCNITFEYYITLVTFALRARGNFGNALGADCLLKKWTTYSCLVYMDGHMDLARGKPYHMNIIQKYVTRMSEPLHSRSRIVRISVTVSFSVHFPG